MQQDARSTDIIVGVDTHKDTHAAVALNALGARLGATILPVSRAGYRQIETWAQSFGTVAAFGIEGTGSYGAGLARALREGGHRVLKVNRPDRSARRRSGLDQLENDFGARPQLGIRAPSRSRRQITTRRSLIGLKAPLQCPGNMRHNLPKG
ncbi:transposase [Xanthobacter autotrophicus]|uniref:IS110 family transposase n=1 Tax=Xanthobacter TaxID=279 RepID=UPI0037282420